MFKFLFDLLTDPFGLPIHPLWEYLILLIVGAIAFAVAWDASPGGKFGAIIHWIVRLGVFVVLWAVLYGIIAFVQWITVHWVLVLCIIGTILLVTVGILLALCWRKKKAGEHNA